MLMLVWPVDGEGQQLAAMVTRLSWAAGQVAMLRHPMGEARDAWASKELGWAGDSPQHRDGPRQGPRHKCSSKPRDESPY